MPNVSTARGVKSSKPDARKRTAGEKRQDHIDAVTEKTTEALPSVINESIQNSVDDYANRDDPPARQSDLIDKFKSLIPQPTFDDLWTEQDEDDLTQETDGDAEFQHRCTYQDHIASVWKTAYKFMGCLATDIVGPKAYLRFHSDHATSRIALVRLQQEQEEVFRLREARDSLSDEVTQQARQITNLTEEFTNADGEQQRLRDSLEQGKTAHAGTTAMGEELRRQLSETKGSLEAAQCDIKLRQDAYNTLQKTLDDHKTEAKEQHDNLKGEPSALRTGLSIEMAPRLDVAKRVNSITEGVQHFFVRACQIPTSHSGVVNGLALEIQRSTYIAATTESRIDWEIHESWANDLAQEDDEIVQVSSTLELLVLELFGAAHTGQVNTKRCQTAIRKLTEVLLSIPLVHAGVLIQLGTAVLHGITSQAEVSLGIGAAFWQLMTIFEERWKSPYQADWKDMRQRLERLLEAHRHKEAFAVITAKTELQEGELCHFYDETHAVFCRPSWTDAVLFNKDKKSVRFFTKTRWTLNWMDATIEPMGAQDKVILPCDNDRDTEWAMGWDVARV